MHNHSSTAVRNRYRGKCFPFNPKEVASHLGSVAIAEVAEANHRNFEMIAGYPRVQWIRWPELKGRTDL